MARLPQISDFFDTLRKYRHSTTIALVLLYITPYFFPVSWNAVGATWQFVAGLMFFLSFSMIITDDLWPWLKKQFNVGLENNPKIARSIVKSCDMKNDVSDEEVFEISNDEINNFETAKNFCETVLDPKSDFTTSENSIIITESGLEKLREHT